MRKFLHKIFKLALYSPAVLAVMEACVRLFVPDEYYKLSHAVHDWADDEVLGWKNKGAIDDLSYRQGSLVHFQTSPDGFRPATARREKAPGTIRVMLFGNSTTIARDMPEEETIHHFLDSLLDQTGRPYEVINAGVLGYSTDQVLLEIEKNLDAYAPDVVCYGYCINDLSGNQQGFYSGAYKPKFVVEGDSLRFMSPERSNEAIIHAKAGYSLKELVQYSALYGLVRPHIQQWKARFSKQADVSLGDPSELELHARPVGDDPSGGFLLLSKLIGNMDEACREHHAEFMLYAHPEALTTWPPYRSAIGAGTIEPQFIETRLQEITAADSVRFVGLVHHFLENQGRGPFHLLPKDSHCNAMGYRLQAEILADSIAAVFAKH